MHSPPLDFPISQQHATISFPKVHKRLEEEEDRARRFVPHQSRERLMRAVESQLIAAHFAIFHSECSKMIKQEMLQDFGRMYELLARVPEGVKPLLKTLEDYVVEVGLKELDKLGQNAAKNPQEYFDLLLSLYGKYTGIVASSLRGDSIFSASIDKAFRIIINDAKHNTDARGAELLARCCDLFLKKGGRSVVSETEMEEKLNNVVRFPFSFFLFPFFFFFFCRG